MKRRPGSSFGLARPAVLPGPVHYGPAGGGIQLSLRRVEFTRWRRERVPDLDRPTVPHPVGHRGDSPADIVGVVDDSGSTAGTDHNGYRYVAFRRIVNLLADGINGDELDDRIAVVHFADRPEPWLPLTGVRSRSDRDRVRRALQPLTGGGTSIVPALDRAAKLLGNERDDRIQVVLLFTDGESGESAAELRHAVEQLPIGCVHVVVLGNELPSQWLDVPVGSVTALTELRTADNVEWVLARALYRSLSLAWYGPTRPPTATGGLQTSLPTTTPAP